MSAPRRPLAGLVAIAATAGAFGCARAEAAEPRTSAADDPMPASVAVATIRAAATRVVESAAAHLAASPDLRGASGAVHVVVLDAGDPIPGAAALPAGMRILLTAGADTLEETPVTPGVWSLAVRFGDVVRPVPGVRVLTTLPLASRREGRVGDYLVGAWPFEDGSLPATRAYRPPVGLVEVTPELAGMAVSDHVRLGDLLTKGQNAVWPKYLVLDPRTLDKLELTLDRLGRDGIDVRGIGVVSGFRTPWYNGNGGETAGRGDLSRHMYGDAIDLYVDADRDGAMDDLDGDGRIDTGDGRVLAAAVEAVERDHPHLVGGVGVYAPRPGVHGGFVHLDARGFRARW